MLVAFSSRTVANSSKINTIIFSYSLFLALVSDVLSLAWGIW